MARVITDYLDEAVQTDPNKIAVVDDYGNLTYKELREKALIIAGFLSASGISRQPVAISMKKSVKCVCAMLGVLYSGNYYAVLDAKNEGSKRTCDILDAFKPELVICDDLETSPIIGDREGVFAYEEILGEGKDNTSQEIDADDNAIVVFTSGSTGMPKGVVLSHASVIAMLEARTRRRGYKKEDIFCSQFPFYFVTYIGELYASIKNKATIYLLDSTLFFAPQKIIEYLTQNDISIMNWTASSLELLARSGVLEGVIVNSVRMVSFVGEVFPTRYIDVLKTAFPKASLINEYGLSETAGIVSTYTIDDNFDMTQKTPIGLPYEDLSFLIMRDGNQVTGTEQGVLYISGSQLSKGYLNNYEETQKRFISLRDGKSERKYFCTGDYVHRNADGMLVFDGRADFQVKRHGYRIELEEIEACALKNGAIADCACAFYEEEQRIILFYVGEISEKDLFAYLRDYYPVYYRPDIIKKISDLPHNPNGKKDRVTLKYLYKNDL